MLEQIKLQIRQKIQEELAKNIDMIPQIVEQEIKSQIRSIIGIHKWSNNRHGINEHSPVKKCIEAIVTETVEERLKDHVLKTLNTVLKSKTFPEEIKQTVVRSVNNSFLFSFKTKYQEALDELTNSYINAIKENFDTIKESIDIQIMDNMEMDINNPESLNNPLNAKLIEHKIKEMIN